MNNKHKLIYYNCLIIFSLFLINQIKADNGSKKDSDSKGYLTYNHMSDC